MEISEKEVKRIISNYFKQRYDMRVDLEDMTWQYNERTGGVEGLMLGEELGGDIIGEDDSDSD